MAGLRECGVVFCIPHTLGIEKLPYSIGTAYMAAYLKDKGIESDTIAGLSNKIADELDRFKQRGVRIVGISVYDIHFPYAKSIANKARHILPDALIVAGGPTATFGSEIVLKNISEIDIVVRGEGEEALYELYKYSTGEQSLENIKGISYREGDKILNNPDRPLMDSGTRYAELDILSSPFKAGVLTGLEALTGLSASRGCTYNCTFCCHEMFKGKIRYHSIDRVIDDLKVISGNIGRNMEKTCVTFWDDNICFNKERTRRLFERIIDEKLRFLYHVSIRAELVDREILGLMKEAGVSAVNFGLESAVPKILRNIKKVGGKSPDFKEEKKYLESIRKVVKDCKQLGIIPIANVIFGLPGSTLEDGLATLKMIEELDLKTYQHSHFMIFVGTEIYKNYESFGMQVLKSSDVLPLKVKHNYDINQIPLLPNAFPVNYGLVFIRSFENAIFEWWNINHPDFKVFKPHFVFENYHQIDEKTLNWIAQTRSLVSGLFFKYDDRKPSVKEIAGIRNILAPILFNCPVSVSVQVLTKAFEKKQTDVTHYRLKTGCLKNPSFWPSDYFSYPFSIAEKTRKKPGAGSIVFFRIDTREDAGAFIKEMSARPEDIGDSIIGKMIRDEILFASSCRFMNQPCPALALQKLQVRENGEISTCEHGKPVGLIGDTMTAIKDHTEKLASEIYAKRGCDSCEAKESCARCIFPSPFTEDEYCSFVKSARWLPKILQLISICHTQALKEIFYKNIKPGKNHENVSKDIPAPVPVSTVPDILGIYNYI